MADFAKISFPQGFPHTPFQEKKIITAVPETTVNKLNKSYNITDTLLQQVDDLINPTFRSWYCGAAYKLGGANFLRLADEARKGSFPARLFSYLLKRAL